MTTKKRLDRRICRFGEVTIIDTNEGNLFQNISYCTRFPEGTGDESAATGEGRNGRSAGQSQQRNPDWQRTQRSELPRSCPAHGSASEIEQLGSGGLKTVAEAAVATHADELECFTGAAYVPTGIRRSVIGSSVLAA